MNRALQYKIDLVRVLTHKELKVKYKSSYLGYLWSVAHPMAFAAVFFVAFKIVMKIDIDDYVLFLVTGLFPWQWMSNSVLAAPTVFLGNTSIIKKVDFPRNFLPLTQTLQDMIHFILAIPVVTVVLLAHGRYPSVSWAYGIPLLLTVQLFQAYGLSLLLSSINLFFRDLERLTSIVVLLVFYCTPIFYSEEMVPEAYRSLVTFNPVSPIIVSWRGLLMHGRLDTTLILLSCLYSAICFAAGRAVYNGLKSRFAEVV